jgi:hypothetical protein
MPPTPDGEGLTELGKMEIVFGNLARRKEWSNICLAVRVVVVQLVEEIAVVVAGKLHIKAGQQLGVGNLVEEGGIVVRGLGKLAHNLWVEMFLQLLQDIFPVDIALEGVVDGIELVVGLVR